MLVAFNVFTPKLLYLKGCYALCSLSLNELSHTKFINLVVTCTDHCTCHDLRIPDKKLNFGGICEILNIYRNLAIAKVARLASLNAVFVS